MKKFFLVLLLIVVLIGGGLFTWLYVNYLRDKDPYKTFLLPKIDLSIIEITSLTAEKTEMNMSILMKNQLPFSFTVDSFEYRLYINDAEVMKSRYKNTVSLSANDSSWIRLPVTILNHDLDSVIDANEARKIDSAEYRMHASFNTNILFNKKLNVTVRRNLPLIHIPDVNVEDIRVDSLNFKRADIILNAAIRNDNVFEIKIRDYSYEMQIEDHDLIKGKVKGVTTLKARGTTNISIPVTLSFKEFGKTLFELLKKGKKVQYNLTLNLTIESEINMIKKSKAIIKSSGTVKSLLKAAKSLS
jgi:LEA14-like dessication related protein